MDKVKIMLDYIGEPIWIKTEEDPIFYPGLDEKMQEDPILVDYCNKAMLLYFSYFEEDSHDEPMWFNEDREKSTAEVMLFYITEIKKKAKTSW